MKTRGTRCSVTIAAFVSSALGWLAIDQGRSYAAYRRLQDVDWMRTAARADQRLAAHRALGLWFSDPHDAFSVLLAMGDRSSIPILRKALEREPKTDTVACTWTHARQALSRLEREVL